MPAFLLLSGPSAGLRREITGEIVIGRSPSCELPLEDSKVSRRHAKIYLEDGHARVADLGSRNGTLVNGEKLDGEATLLPGDRVQVGDSTILYEPPAKASLTDLDVGDLHSVPIEEVLPAAGAEGALYSSGAALLSATSEAMVLRRGAEEVGRAVSADRSVALLGGIEGLITAAVVGAETIEVPRALVRAAIERKEVGRAAHRLCAPIAASGGLAFGVLYAERDEAFESAEQKLAAAVGRLTGEALSALRARSERQDGGRDANAAPVVLAGSSRQFRKTVEQARRCAAGDETVTLYGEPGSGRAHAALYIHSRSARALGPFVVVDCQGNPLAVDEELFGRPSGPGVPPISSAMLRADGGTLLLRNVELLPRHSVERLARLLQRRAAPARQGGEEPINTRLMVTSSQPPAVLAAKNEFDGELARALAGAEIELLPLRDRRTDVPGLFEALAAPASRSLRKEGPTLTPDARRLMVDYHWPGNVRELKLVAERLGLLYPAQEISALRLPPEVQEGLTGERPRTLQEMIARLERDAIAEALREARGKKIRAAAILGISRPTLDKKIEDFQLVVEKVRK